MKKKRVFFASIAGNLLDHYDMNLYGLLAPFFAPYFFPDHDPVVQLIMAYGLMSVSFITRPLGAFVFGRLARHHSPHRLFIFCLLGVAVTTGFMGILPVYSQIGVFAPILLAITRMLQGFFGAGESSLAGLYLLSQKKPEHHGFWSGFYQSSTILGILLASSMSMIISFLPETHFYWRLPFIFGFVTGLTGLYLRSLIDKESSYQPKQKEIGSDEPFGLLKHKKLILRIAFVSSFTYLTYVVPFVFMNSFVPFVASQITLKEMLAMNTGFLVLDMILCPIFGKLADHVSKKKIMLTMPVFLLISIVPLFYCLKEASLLTVAIIRLWIVCLGVGFLAPLYPWFIEVIPQKDRFLLKGVGYALGTETLGRSLPAICLFLWHATGWVLAPAFYIGFVCILTIWAVLQN